MWDMVFEILSNGYVELIQTIIVLFVLWVLRHKILNREPSLEELDGVCASMEAEIQELKGKVTSMQLEVWDYVDGSLRPLLKRQATREKREQEKKDLNNSEDTEKKGGIIPFPKGYNKYGSTR